MRSQWRGVATSIFFRKICRDKSEILALKDERLICSKISKNGFHIKIVFSIA